MELGYTKFSRYQNDENLFHPYAIDRLTYVTEQKCDGTAFWGVVGEDEIPIVFSVTKHLQKRLSQRFGLSYSEILIEKIISLVESNRALGDILLETMPIGNPYKRIEIALWDEVEDIFYYLHPYGEYVEIGTVIDGKPFYFVNPAADAFCWVTGNGDLVLGLENIPKFKKKISF